MMAAWLSYGCQTQNATSRGGVLRYGLEALFDHESAGLNSRFWHHTEPPLSRNQVITTLKI